MEKKRDGQRRDREETDPGDLGEACGQGRLKASTVKSDDRCQESHDHKEGNAAAGMVAARKGVKPGAVLFLQESQLVLVDRLTAIDQTRAGRVLLNHRRRYAGGFHRAG